MTGVLNVLALASLFAVVRVLKGPTLADRAVALDVLAMTAIGMISALAVDTEQALLMDAAVVLALIAFLSTIAFAFYLKRWVK